MRLFHSRMTGQVATFLLVAFLFYLFPIRGMRFFLVPSNSMEPTLVPMDHLVTIRESDYQRGDIVVLDDPEEKGGYIVKRIAALGGDTVTITGGALYVNGEYISEPYINECPAYYLEPTAVPPGKVFLLGDNRNYSDDSHLWDEKCQPLESIVGKACFRYFPYERFGPVHSYPFVSVPVKALNRA